MGWLLNKYVIKDSLSDVWGDVMAKSNMAVQQKAQSFYSNDEMEEKLQKMKQNKSNVDNIFGGEK